MNFKKYQQEYYIKNKDKINAYNKKRTKERREKNINKIQTVEELKSLEAKHGILKKFKQLLIDNTIFLPITASIMQRFYHLKNNIINIPMCKKCLNDSKFKNFNKGYYIFCSNKCSVQFSNSNEKTKLKISSKNKLSHSKKTKRDKEITQEKREATYFKNYGDINHMKTQKYRDLFSVISTENSFERLEKTKKTLIRKFGVENASQIDSIKKKKEYNKLFRTHDYIFPSGKNVKIQGFGKHALDILLNELKINEDDILVEKEINPIKYTFNDKNKLYFPDIFIKSLNKIIEVKSDYWYYKTIELNLVKQQACLDMGFDYEFYVFDKRKNIIKNLLHG